MPIRAILFDMDGVLIDAREWHYEALNRALSLFGMPISRIDHLTSFDGLPTRRKLELLTMERGLPEHLHEFINEMKQRFTMELVHTRCHPTFAHEYALSALRSKGYKIAACSNSVRQSVEVMMTKANLAPYLDLMVSNEDVTRAKPDPEIYVSAMNSLGVAPAECLIVEDNENGIRAAKAAGGHLLVVRDPAETTFDNVMRAIREAEAAGGQR